MKQAASILLIDDDIVYGELLSEYLTLCGYRVNLQFSATGGLDTIKSQKIDLVICDLNLPYKDGIQIFKDIHAMQLNVPIVLISGENEMEIVREALKLGAADYLIKPLVLSELPIVIEKNIARSELQRNNVTSGAMLFLKKVLTVLMKALDAKDTYTLGHSLRVARLAKLMGEALQLCEDDLHNLQISAFLHDIGKIGIPDRILKKREELHKDEINITRDHPEIGSNLLAEIPGFNEIASAIRHHHERYDGSGYPDGLKGEAIPLFARIIAIVDAYEALISNRCYRRGTDADSALCEIIANSGTQFDPALVDVFRQVVSNNLNEKSIPEKLIFAGE
jgi:response regulator RpfG family c-di-GMP phosphodiesterase